MTRSGQSARTGEHLVDRAAVDPRFGLLAIFLRQQPDQRELGVELLRVRFVKVVGLGVPAGALHVHSIDEAAILRGLADGGWSRVVAHLEVVAKLIDGDLVLSCVVLEGTREESLWEEETRDPEGSWGSAVNPFGEERDPII